MSGTTEKTKSASTDGANGTSEGMASPALRDKMLALLREHGPNKTAKMLKVGREVPVRIAAGIEVRRGSLLLVEQNVKFLSGLEQVA